MSRDRLSRGGSEGLEGWAPEGPTADDELLARPFLTRRELPTALGPEWVPGAAGPPFPVPPAGQPSEVRPYLLTGGRTHSRGDAVAMETVVLATGLRPVRACDAAGVERAWIVRLAESPCSTSELAAWLHLPLQVALVLVSDLVAEGLLDASGVAVSQSDDVFFLERLIAGVAAL